MNSEIDRDFQESPKLTWEARVTKTQEKAKVFQEWGFSDRTRKKIAVIVPIYGTEKFLPACLNSITAQEFDSFEIICVNDGSPGNATEILRSFATTDSRIKFVSKTNQGYGHSINLGIDLSNSDFVAIVESDDFIQPGMLSTLWHTATQNDLDFIKADFYRFTNTGSGTRLFYSPLSKKSGNYNRILEATEDRDLMRFTNTWTGLYRTSFLKRNNIRHQETPGASFQDNGFWFITTICAKRFMYLKTPFYMNRRDNPRSSVFNKRNPETSIAELQYISNYLSINPPVSARHRHNLFKRKWDLFKYTYRRINTELRLNYALEMADLLARDVVNSYVRPADFRRKDWNLLLSLLDSPQMFCESFSPPNQPDFLGIKHDASLKIFMPVESHTSNLTYQTIERLCTQVLPDTNFQVNLYFKSQDDNLIRRLEKFRSSSFDLQVVLKTPEAELASGFYKNFTENCNIDSNTFILLPKKSTVDSTTFWDELGTYQLNGTKTPSNATNSAPCPQESSSDTLADSLLDLFILSVEDHFDVISSNTSFSRLQLDSHANPPLRTHISWSASANFFVQVRIGFSRLLRPFVYHIERILNRLERTKAESLARRRVNMD